ncbi:ABC transporter permease [Acetobacterium sp.]|jgi:peptide/nickel transport system permease protein|uniref:ABC transporter permease n=1 Tax=Acetobacterium sp. TaxID=1872094 RepID=UPI000CC5125E|nr:ABC transporter permease [Acetobacterium sp.]MDO9492343.1 ABC transporter permease [Acetobacterium sp.]PKM74548.1 MAG: glutathione ABC transporter permease GsiC [Firmicutes bacterium HGW-Firmicutes-17]
MKKIIINRVLMILPTVITIAFLAFSIMYFSPGNPAEILMRYRNPEGGTDPAALAHYEEMLGINDPFLTQFENWGAGILTGDFGESFKTGNPVTEEFFYRIGYTLMLSFTGLAFSLVIGITLGFLSAEFKDSWLDNLLRFTQSLKMSIPSFWLALFFIYIFSTQLRWFSAFGYNSPKDLILPGLVLGLSNSSRMVRLVRTCILEEKGSGYVYTARVKGLSEIQIFFKHILKNITLPIITLTGVSLVSMIGGSLIIENIFGLPGIGTYLVSAIVAKDYPVSMGFLFAYGVIIVFINLFIDIVYQFVDPRVRDCANAEI